MRGNYLALAVLVTTACYSASPSPARPDSVASVSVHSIAPEAGGEIHDSSVITADIDYSIDSFSDAAEYYLAPLFDSRDAAGGTFNAYDHVTDGLRLTASRGSVRLHYPIAKEWRSGELTKPIRVSFYIMVRTGPHTTKILGKTPVIEFRPAG